jgi:acyl dehydratase
VATEDAPLTDADLVGMPSLVHGRTFEEMEAGSRFRTASRTITETDLVTFVTLTGMNEPLFLDEAASLDAGYGGGWCLARWCSPTPKVWSCRRG